MRELLFYGLDEAGETVRTERLAPIERDALRDLARQRLAEFAAVEIWDGPLCVVRLRREATEKASI